MHARRRLLKRSCKVEVRRGVVNRITFDRDKRLDLPSPQLLHELRQAGLRVAACNGIEVGDGRAELCVDPMDKRLDVWRKRWSSQNKRASLMGFKVRNNGIRKLR